MTAESAEMLEVVDEQGRFIRLASRLECHSDPSLIHRSVCVLVLDPEGRLYMQKRSRSKARYAGMWDLSATGHVSPGETWEEAARRELAEELGIQADLRLVTTMLVPVPAETELAAIFRCEHGGPIQPDPAEIEYGAFYEVSEALAIPDLTPYAATILQRVAGLLTG